MSSPTLPPKPTAEFCPELARTIVLALATYGPTLNLAVEYSEEGDAPRLGLLQDVSRTIGLELLVFARMCTLMKGQFPAADDPAPVLPLVRVLGESLAVLGLVQDKETAQRLPMASLDETDTHYDRAARDWLYQYVEELPERQKETT